MVIEYERKIEDILEFTRFHLEHSPNAKSQIFLSRVIVASLSALLGLGLIYLLDADKNLSLSAYALCIVGGIVAFFIYPPFHRWYTKNQTKKFLSEGDNQSLLGHQRITASPEGLLCESTTGQSRINWSAIKKVAENEKYVFCYFAATNALVIPKDAFSDDQKQSEFLEMINNNSILKSLST